MGSLKFAKTFLVVFHLTCFTCTAVTWAQQSSWTRQELRTAPHSDFFDAPVVGATRQLISSSPQHSLTHGLCGESVVVSRGQSVRFSSPGFPAKYPGFSRCYWAFQTEDPSANLTLQCDQFQLTPVELCNKFEDFLLVEERSTGRAQWFCGGVGPRNLASTSMWVTFWSNEHDTRKGFSCHVFADGGAGGAGGAGSFIGGAVGQAGGGVAVIGASPGTSGGVLTGHRRPPLRPEATASPSRHRCNCGVRNTRNTASGVQATRGRPRFPRQDAIADHEERTELKYSEVPVFSFERNFIQTSGNFSQYKQSELTTLVNENGTSLLQRTPTSTLEEQSTSSSPITDSEYISHYSTPSYLEHRREDGNEGASVPENLSNLMQSVNLNASADEHVILNRVRKHGRNFQEDFSVSPSTKIVNGSPVSPHEFPWLVLLEYPHLAGVHCAGSLISSRHVLTAAHCTQYFNGLMTVILGEHDRTTHFDTPHTRRVPARMVTAHPLFNSSTNDNDIAIVMLDTDLRLDEVGPYISPICPPNPNDLYERETTFIVGWGTTSERDQRGSTIPLAAVVRTLGQRECQDQLAETAVTPNMICASGRGTDTCQNDSGGPLMARYKGSRYVLVGIVSWGIGCARPAYPGVYTRVGKYLEWIKDNTKGSKTCPPAQLT